MAYHKAVEDFLKQKIFQYELNEQFLRYYNNSTYKLPTFEYGSLDQFYLPKIEKHFQDFSFLNGYEIISVEETLLYSEDGEDYITIPDVLARNKATGFYEIFDHKSSKKYTKQKALRKLRQLYMNCEGIKQKYGIIPQKLNFNHFRENVVISFDFDKKQFQETEDWQKKKIEAIRNETEFTPKCLGCDGEKDFYASNLCGLRFDCPYKNSYSDSQLVRGGSRCTN